MRILLIAKNNVKSPKTIPPNPTIIAINNFFFVIIVFYNFHLPWAVVLRIFSIDNVPNKASSNRIVSVAWLGKKLNVLEF